MAWPFWRISNHSDLVALHHALDLGYLWWVRIWTRSDDGKAELSTCVRLYVTQEGNNAGSIVFQTFSFFKRSRFSNVLVFQTFSFFKRSRFSNVLVFQTFSFFKRSRFSNVLVFQTFSSTTIHIHFGSWTAKKFLLVAKNLYLMEANRTMMIMNLNDL